MKNLIKGMKKGSIYFGELISNFVNTLLLTIVYIIALFPTYLIAKLFHKKFLKLKSTKSNWGEYSQETSTQNNYRQF